MIMVVATLGALVIGVLVGLAIRGCLVLGDKRQLDLTVQRLIAEARIDATTRRTLAAVRQATRDAFRR